MDSEKAKLKSCYKHGCTKTKCNKNKLISEHVISFRVGLRLMGEMSIDQIVRKELPIIAV